MSGRSGSGHLNTKRSCLSDQPTQQQDPDPVWMLCREDLFFWEGNTPASPYTFESKLNPWDRPGKPETRRFAAVVIEIREKEVRGTVDGQPLTPVTEAMFLGELLQNAKDRPRFPAAAVVPPAFGTGIGIILQYADCVVRNLSVSKLKP